MTPDASYGILGVSTNQEVRSHLMACRVCPIDPLVHVMKNAPLEALAATAQARELKAQMGDRIGVANVDNTRASVLLALEHYDEARTICEGTAAEAESGNAERLLGGYLDTLAQIQLAQGKATESLATLQRILGLPGASTDVSLMRDVRCHLVLALLAQGQVEAAQCEWNSLTESNDPRNDIEQNLAGGWLGRARGDLRAAEEYVRRARERTEASGYALYANGVKRLEKALQNPSQPADLRF
jgi:tetratricopeptide (TPR) repeat protein